MRVSYRSRQKLIIMIAQLAIWCGVNTIRLLHNDVGPQTDLGLTAIRLLS